MDDRSYFELRDEQLSHEQVDFLAALRHRLGERLRPYSTGAECGRLLLCMDVDAPDIALVTVGLDLGVGELRGDRISIHDWTLPNPPTSYGFAVQGTPDQLAERAADLLETFARRPVVRHEWLNRGQVYASCHLFEDTGERLSQMYRTDLAPPGQEARLVADGHVFGKGWFQTEGLEPPDRVVRVRGGE